jgi:hypothetical protein
MVIKQPTISDFTSSTKATTGNSGYLDKTDWSTFNGKAPTVLTSWSSFTPAITGTSSNPALGTNTTVAYYRLNANGDLEMMVSIDQTAAGSDGSGAYLITLPNSYSIGSSAIVLGSGTADNAGSILGVCHVSDATYSCYGFVKAHSATTVYCELWRQEVADDDDIPIYIKWGSGNLHMSHTALHLGLKARIPL